MNLTDEVLADLEAAAKNVHRRNWETAAEMLTDPEINLLYGLLGPEVTLALVAEVRRLRAREAEFDQSASGTTPRAARVNAKEVEYARLVGLLQRMAEHVPPSAAPVGHFGDCPASDASGACDCGSDEDGALPFVNVRDPGHRVD